MTADALLLLYAFLAVTALIVLIARFKLHPIIALVAAPMKVAGHEGAPARAVLRKR